MQVLAPVTRAFGAGEAILALAVEISRIVFDFTLCADVNTVLHSAPSILAPQWGQYSAARSFHISQQLETTPSATVTPLLYALFHRPRVTSV